MSGSPLRSLVVLHEPPLKEGRASGRCVNAMLRGLAAHGVDVRAIAASQAFAMAGEPPPDVPIEVVDAPQQHPGLRASLSSLRRPVSELARGEFADRVREGAREVDVLHLEEVETAGLDRGVDVPSVLRLQYLIRWDQSFGAPWRPPFRRVLEFDRAERRAIRRHDVFIPASPRVADELRRRRPGAVVELVPLCLDPADYPPATLDGPPVAGIIGTAAWPITAAAMRRLVADVWPEVRQIEPEARLLVAGRGTDSLGLVAPGVDVLGTVPSAVDFLRGLSLLLYPIGRGSGVKVKTLESIACGLPVVTTTFGAEGVDGGDGVVVADDVRGLAGAAARILRDEGERRERGKAAREAFERRYTPVPATEPLADLYRRISS